MNLKWLAVSTCITCITWLVVTSKATESDRAGFAAVLLAAAVILAFLF